MKQFNRIHYRSIPFFLCVIACFCFLFLNHMLVLKYDFSYCSKILSLFILNYFDSRLMFVIDFIIFLFNFPLLSRFHSFYGLIGCIYFWKVLMKYHKVLSKVNYQNLTHCWVLVKKSLNIYSCSAKTENMNKGATRKSWLLKNCIFAREFEKFAHERIFSHS